MAEFNKEEVKGQDPTIGTYVFEAKLVNNKRLPLSKALEPATVTQ